MKKTSNKSKPNPKPKSKPKSKPKPEKKNQLVQPWLKLKQKALLTILKIRNRPYRLLKYPDRRLYKTALPVTKFDAKLRHQIQRMSATLNNQKWGMKLGISAPQVGINRRFFIMGNKVIINPEWQPTKAPPETIIESCYSVGDATYRVSRAKYGWAKYQTITGEWKEEKLKGLAAVVFQHELEHLNGKCCIDVGELVTNEL